MAIRGGEEHDARVRRELTAERVRSDIEVLARGGLDVATFLAEVDDSLRRAVPHAGACYALVDPSTQLLTKTFKYGDLAGRDDHDGEWATIEYGDAEATSFSELAGAAMTAAGVHSVTGGDVTCSRRMRDYMVPYFDYRDELRALARAGDHVWGGVALFRGSDDSPFALDEIAFVGSLSPAIAAGIRSGVLARCAVLDEGDGPPGPAVVIVDAAGAVSHMSAGAERLLDTLVADPAAAAPTGTLAALVARARRWAGAATAMAPRVRVRTGTGEWYVLHAAPLNGRDGSHGDVVITIEPARPPDIVPLVVAAFDLTAREREVTRLVLHGVETKQIAAELHLSPYTVQDHLKAIFEKAEVRSRRELMARVFFDHYAPRIGTEIAPSGSFLPPVAQSSSQ